MMEETVSEELQSYIENKGKLEAALKDGISFASSYTGHVGIINQGSTCYLNSLIQCLFHDLPFRNLLLQATSDTAILLALQEIFCYLQLSESSAVSTKDLVAAFGWSRGQVFEQHDVHELFGLLLDTLGDSSTDIKENVSKLYRGMMTDVLHCPSCGYQRRNDGAFLNISLELNFPIVYVDHPTVDMNGFSVPTEKLELRDLLESHMQSETLDADNRWECSGCCERVQAVKYNEYTSLPPSLMIHLNRLRYNTVSKRREKVTTPVFFPCILDTSMLTKCQASDNGGATRQTTSESVLKAPCNVETEVGAVTDLKDCESSLYRLHSILLHTGTANGGHYKAYVLDSITGRWLECNDSSVCELSEREEASLLDKPLTSEFNYCDTESSDRNDDGKDRSSIKPSPSGENTKKYVTFKDDILRKNAYMLLYKRVSVIAKGENLLPGSNLEAYSSEEKEEANRLFESFSAAVPTELSQKILAENKTLQELRRLHRIHMKTVALKIVYDGAILHGLGEESCETSMSNVSNGYTNGSARSDMRTIDLLALNTDSLKNVQSRVCSLLHLSTALSSGCSYRLREFSEVSGRKGTTYGTRGNESLMTLGLYHPYSFPSPPPVVMLLESRTISDPPFPEMNDKAMQLRVLIWSEKLQAAVEATEGLSETLGGLFPIGSDSVDCAATDPNPNVATVQASMMEILVPGEHLATLGALREAIALELNYAVTQITLIMSNDKEALVMELDQDHRSLKKAYGICPGDLVFVEIREASSPSFAVDSEVHDTPPALTTDSEALNALKRYLCMITIRFNDPRSPVKGNIIEREDDSAVLSQDKSSPAVHDQSLKVPSHMVLEDVKKLISEKLGMGSVNDFHLVRSDCPSAPQYKDGTLSLYDLGVGDQGILHIRMGQGCGLGEHFLMFECEAEVSISAAARVTTTTTATTTSLPAKKKVRSTFLTKMIVHEALTVMQLKELLLASWGSLLPIEEGLPLPPTPLSANHIRLRDAKVPGSSGLGTFMRSERVLYRCLLGISDGRKIVVQVLKEAEIIDPLDWIISVRVVTYSTSSSSDSACDSSTLLEGSASIEESVSKLQREDSGQNSCGDYSTKKVHRAVDIPVSRTATVRQLYGAILKHFPHLKELPQAISMPPASAPQTQSGIEEGVTATPDAVTTEADQKDFVEKSLISLAKGFSSGPPITLKSSVKLSWDPSVLVASPDTKIDHQSLNFRDGILLLVRSAADWQRALTQDPTLSGTDGDMAMSANVVRTAMKPLPPWKTRSSSLRKSGDAAGPAPKTESPRLKEKGLSLSGANGACSKQG